MKSLDKAMAILMTFAETQRDFGVVEIAERLDMPRSQVSKVMATLRDRKLLVQNPVTRRYEVGVQAFVLGAKYLSFDKLCHEAIPQLYKLVHDTGHSARLSVVSDSRAIFLVAIEGPHLQDTGWRAGTWLPWHASSAARVMLAHLDAPRRQEILANLELGRLTEHTTTDIDQLRAMLEAAHEHGFDIQRSEITVGLGTISVPVFGMDGVVAGSISFAFPEALIGASDVPALVEILHGTARLISLRMGNIVYRAGSVAAG